MDWFTAHYDFFRALHIIAVIAWMAGLLYLPRLYVYHSPVEVGTDLDKTLTIMEKKLCRYIMEPSMYVVWALGICLIMARGMDLFKMPFFHVKLLCVSLITIIHMFYGKWQKDFADGKRPLNHVFFRVINEMPFILMIIAVFMVVLEPSFG